MATYKLNEEAEEDLKRIYRRGVREYGLEQADRYYDAFFERFDRIAENPSFYQKVDYIRKGYRRCVCGSDGIYYRIVNDVVEIMTIIGRQDIYSKK